MAAVSRAMNGLRSLRLIAVAAALLFLLPPPSVQADCAAPPPIEEAVRTADIVFVGTVTETTNRDTWATVAVHEVWRGPAQPSTVMIKGGPGGNAGTTDVRAFETGLKYVFFPYVDQDIEPLPGQVFGLADNGCTSTVPWAEAMIALRPAEVLPPVATTTGEPGFDLLGVIQPIALALVVAGLLLGIGLIARGRQSD